MAYSSQTGDPAVSGGNILAADFNNLLDLFTQVWGNPGYGQRVDIARRIARTVTPININSQLEVTSEGDGYILVSQHGFSDGDVVQYNSNGNPPLGELRDDIYYYVDRVNDNIFTLSVDANLLTHVQITQTSGIHTINKIESNVIGHDEWDELRQLIETARRHQTGGTFGITAPQSTNVITTQNSPGQKNSVNEWYTAVNTLINDLTLVDSDNITLDFTNPDQGDFTRDQWGGRKELGFAQSIAHIFPVQFPGGYYTTNVGGETVEATSADHRRHFFNTGGKIVIKLELTGGTDEKTVDWATMLSNLGYIYFGKSSTTSTKTGVSADGSSDLDGNGNPDPAVGNDQLTSSPKLIAYKGGSGVYAENSIQIFAYRAGNNILFETLLSDADSGDKRADSDVGQWVDKDTRVTYNGWLFGPQLGPDSRTPAGPGEDEFVLGSGGTLTSSVYTAYSTEYAPVQKPDFGPSLDSF